jgi:hypothetical protein
MTNLPSWETFTPPEADAADRYRDRSLGRFRDRDPEGFLEIGAMLSWRGSRSRMFFNSAQPPY